MSPMLASSVPLPLLVLAACTVGPATSKNVPPTLPCRSMPCACCALNALASACAVRPSWFCAGSSTLLRKSSSAPRVPPPMRPLSTLPEAAPTTSWRVASYMLGAVASACASVPVTSAWPLPTNTLMVLSFCGTTLMPTWPASFFTSASRWSSRSAGGVPSVACEERISPFNLAIDWLSLLIEPTVSPICCCTWPDSWLNWPDSARNVLASPPARASSTWREAASDGALAMSCTAPKKLSSEVCRLLLPESWLLSWPVRLAMALARPCPELADHSELFRNWLYARCTATVLTPVPT